MIRSSFLPSSPLLPVPGLPLSVVYSPLAFIPSGPSSSLSLHAPGSLSLAVGVMYGPCQCWNQWDAGCFNLAWEPSGSGFSTSGKSDGRALSLLCFYSPPPSSLLPYIDQHLARSEEHTSELQSR